MQTADVVIIGGGIVGSSIAYHLTANGCGNVLVIERESAQGKGEAFDSMGTTVQSVEKDEMYEQHNQNVLKQSQ